MIREYAPIVLIPAAWAMTFATMIYPGIDTYWIQHMHYFMILFLTGFTLASWQEMDSKVLDVWRKIIAAGILFTGLGAYSFLSSEYSEILGASSLGYWLLAPGIGCYLSSRQMENYRREYRAVGYTALASLLIVSIGIYSAEKLLTATGFLMAAASQTLSIVIASRMDGNM